MKDIVKIIKKKKKTTDGEKRFANHMPNEGLISRIHKKIKTQLKNYLIRKMFKIYEHFSGK